MTTTPQALIDPLLAGLDRALGASYAAVLFGSVAHGDYIEGVSDVNVLIVLDDGTPATLEKLHQPLMAWYDAGQMAPLLLTREEWHRASDVFPIEVVDLQDAHRLLRWMPMPIADMVEDWFASAMLRAADAAHGLLGTPHGPRAGGRPGRGAAGPRAARRGRRRRPHRP